MNSDQCPAVAEIQGLYGPFTFPEKLLQQIWARRDFDERHALTADGRAVRILHPGKWNHLGGPDFSNARLRIGGADLAGDVEVHLRESDWDAHRHAADPAYANVVLHVVLFPPRSPTTRGAGARAIPILALLPLLRHDLEQYAADDAIERLAGHPLSRAQKDLSALPQPGLLAALARHAEQRWRRKIHYAGLRIRRLGWEEACHHAALEILGYAANRAPMLAIAEKFPLKTWRARAEKSTADAARFADGIFAEHSAAGANAGAHTSWARQAARPANHPRTRLRQYAAWIAARPDWPQRATAIFDFAPGANISAPPTPGSPAPSVAAWRRAQKLPALRKHIATEICGGGPGGTRLDTFICDGLLPLLAARMPERAGTLGVFWKNWFVGDMPAEFPKLLRALEVTGSRDTPAHNGAAQGLLGHLLEAEAATAGAL